MQLNCAIYLRTEKGSFKGKSIISFALVSTNSLYIQRDTMPFGIDKRKG